MARRFVPVLLAARLTYRIQELEVAVASGDSNKLQKETEALRLQWVQFAHIVRERSETLFDHIDRNVAAVTETLPTAPEAVSSHLQELNNLVKELAA